MKRMAFLSMSMLSLHAQAPEATTLTLLRDRLSPAPVSFAFDGPEGRPVAVRLAAPSTGAWGLRLGRDLATWDRWAFAVDGTYRDGSDSLLGMTLDGEPGSSIFVAKDQLRYAYFALGVGLHTTGPVQAGIGLEARREVLRRHIDPAGALPGIPATGA